MLFFDKQRRYLELRALNGTRHIFMRKELENDKEWLENSINYLENITQKRVEHLELINELQKMLKD
jgi:chaperonin cofactor prefoldin